jgi:hypothetical protein
MPEWLRLVDLTVSAGASDPFLREVALHRFLRLRLQADIVCLLEYPIRLATECFYRAQKTFIF